MPMALLLLVDTQNNSENLQDRKGLAILTRGVQHALRSEVNIIFMHDVAQLGVRSQPLNQCQYSWCSGY